MGVEGFSLGTKCFQTPRNISATQNVFKSLLCALCFGAFGASLNKLSFTFSSATLDKDDLNKIKIEDPSVTAGCWIFFYFCLKIQIQKKILRTSLQFFGPELSNQIVLGITSHSHPS